MTFAELNLLPELIEGVDSMGYRTATPIQEQVIPAILQGRDVIASAQTGTGKTAAFLLPLIHKIISGEQNNKIKAMVIVPTRELAVQIDQQMEGLSYFTPISSIAVYGGGDGSLFERERQAMKAGVDIVICTPGRMISHLNMKYIDLSELQFLVLDEADRMLDMGFSDDINKMISFLPTSRQSLLFSATMPQKIRVLARKILQNPLEVSISVSKPNENIKQEVFMVNGNQKIPLVKHLLGMHNFRSVIVFCSTKSSVKQLSRDLRRTTLKIDEIHSELEQKQREEVLMRFKNRELNVLVATDILSRGIDIEDIDLVINYDVPNDGEDYIHRIGRTARAAAKGIAYTFVDETERKKFKRIEDLLGKQVPRGTVPDDIKAIQAPATPVKKPHGKPRRHK
ncbi:MAG TPA: DEAD/DEAH box helicase [Flavobacteriales bacterium]|nr:DEAD/DEAH box helicase [Flavobacteriales bacterium]